MRLATLCCTATAYGDFFVRGGGGNFVTDVFLTGLMETTPATAYSYVHTDAHSSPLATSVNPVRLRVNLRPMYKHTHTQTHGCVGTLAPQIDQTSTLSEGKTQRKTALS